ncbi:hypothetical protein CEXT_410241 [Caerostris extrusa]|uniref:Uncharacterized protein n=1 Tax=Caerostris extrusa TaxID=172846 RepID=A0AAV4S5U5_CAEEX|nr:hypothetical protein CEXT_410241 [Caerostris extrusa]
MWGKVDPSMAGNWRTDHSSFLASIHESGFKLVSFKIEISSVPSSHGNREVISQNGRTLSFVQMLWLMESFMVPRILKVRSAPVTLCKQSNAESFLSLKTRQKRISKSNISPSPN